MTLNIPFFMWYGDMEEALRVIADYYDIESIFSHEETGNHTTYMRDIAVKLYCKNHDIHWTIMRKQRYCPLYWTDA
jgi:deoxyribodipyrimidine photo-lyase